MTDNMKVWMLFFAFWASGFVFVWPMEKREGFKKRVSLFFGIISGLFVLFIYVLWNGNIWLEVAAKSVC